MFAEDIAVASLQSLFDRFTNPNPFKPGDLVRLAPDVGMRGQRPGMMKVLSTRVRTDTEPLNVRVAIPSKDSDGFRIDTQWIEHWQLMRWESLPTQGDRND